MIYGRRIARTPNDSHHYQVLSIPANRLQDVSSPRKIYIYIYAKYIAKYIARAKFKIRDFLKVPTPKKIFSGKLRPRVRLNIRARNL